MNDESVMAHVHRVVYSRRSFNWNKDRITALRLSRAIAQVRGPSTVAFHAHHEDDSCNDGCKTYNGGREI